MYYALEFYQLSMAHTLPYGVLTTVLRCSSYLVSTPALGLRV